MSFPWKQTVKSAIVRSGIMRLCALFRSQSVAILCYHSVSTDREWQSNCISLGNSVDAKVFDEQMRALREKYHPITLDDIADWLNGNKQLPPRSVAVTFDDGFEDNYSIAAPIMEKYDIRGAIYLAVDAVRRQELPWYCRLHYLFHNKRISGKMGGEDLETEQSFAKSCVILGEEQLTRRMEQIESKFGYKLDLSKSSPGMMTFEQAKELRRRGHIIGSHTLSHGIAGLLTAEQLRREIGEANQILERELGEPIQHFSYPHPYLIDPQWSEDSLRETESIGYKTAVLTQHGSVRRNANPLLLPRVYIGNDSVEQFRWKLENAFMGK